MPADVPIASARAVLEELGFAVEEGVRVKGLSGFEHSFALVARRGERVVCVSLVKANPTRIFAELAKSLDVPHEIIVAVEGEPPPKAIELSHKGRIRVVAFKSAEELVKELKKALT
jgi:sulfur carrier protein ThiS